MASDDAMCLCCGLADRAVCRVRWRHVGAGDAHDGADRRVQAELRALDHLRFISPQRRVEWCPRRGASIDPGTEAELKVMQGRHTLTVRFRNVRFELDHLIEDEFLSWPLRGARHTQTFEAAGEGD